MTPTFDELQTGSFDSRRIKVQGIVHSAKLEIVWGRKVLLANLYLPGGSISVHILDYSGIAAGSLVDSTVSFLEFAAPNSTIARR